MIEWILNSRSFELSSICDGAIRGLSNPGRSRPRFGG